MANADDVERVFRSDILPELVALLQPRGFKARVSRHDFIRRVSHGSQQLALLRSCYTGRRYDYIVDYAIRIEDERAAPSFAGGVPRIHMGSGSLSAALASTMTSCRRPSCFTGSATPARPRRR